MRPIPLEHIKIINSEPYYKKSCLSGLNGTWNDRIVIHHPWLYAGKQINEIWAYMPLLDSEHEELSKNLVMRNKVKLLSLQRADLKEIQKKYPRHDWKTVYNYLNKLYGNK